VQRALSARGAHATFALHRDATRSELTAMAAGGNDVMPELTQGKTMHWLKTRGILKHDARDFALPKRFYFLAPRKGFNLGEYFYGRVSGARAVDGAVRMTLPNPRVNRPVQRGQVVVVTVDPRAPGSMVALDELLATLARGGLTAVSLDDLAGSPAVKT
jgi:hypothetical protein